MKLLYLTEDKFPPYRADVVELFAKKISGYGNRIDWLMQSSESCMQNSDKVLKWLGNTVYLVPCLSSNGRLNKALNLMLGHAGDWKAISLAITNHYDAIQVRDKYLSSVPAWIAARMSSAKFYYWMSYPFPESRLYMARKKHTKNRIVYYIKGIASYIVFYYFIIKVADHIFVQSDQMLEDVAAKGVSKNKLTVVPMGVRSDQLLTTTKIRPLDTVAPKLLYLGTLARIRHLNVLIDALKIVRINYPNATLWFVGEADSHKDRAYLENYAMDMHQSENTVFTGFLPMDKAWEYVMQADICLSPIYPIPVLLAGSPTKLIEYMAMGKVVVANEHPEQIKVLHESKAGRPVAWDAQSFANEIIYLLDNADIAKKMAACGPDYVRSYRTYDVIAKQVNDKYKHLLS